VTFQGSQIKSDVLEHLQPSTKLKKTHNQRFKKTDSQRLCSN